MVLSGKCKRICKSAMLLFCNARTEPCFAPPQKSNCLRLYAPLCRLLQEGEPQWRRCKCAKYLYLLRDGKDTTVSAKTRSWEKAEQQAQEIRESWDPVKQRLGELDELKQAPSLARPRSPMLWNGGSRPLKRTATPATSIRIANIGPPLTYRSLGARKPSDPSQPDYAGCSRPLEELMVAQGENS
jgi:hypothetical protein